MVVCQTGFLGDSGMRLRGNEHSARETTRLKGIPAMGDRSPKSTQKKASQKQSKADDASSKKQQLITAQQATKAKAAAAGKR
jgi:hypothetical protein